MLGWPSIYTHIYSHKVESKVLKTKKPPVYLPLENSTSKVASTCHEDDPHGLLTYGLQGGSCILLVV